MIEAGRMVAMNEEIQAFIAKHLPAQDDGIRYDSDEWKAQAAKFKTAWFAAHSMPETDQIRTGYGLVKCGDAPGWKYAG